MLKDIYLIHPVRGITKREKVFLDKYVESLESKGMKVHYPIRDVKQDDAGLNICLIHRKVMKNVKEVHVYWKGKSKGSFFDFGMAFLMGKKIVLINRNKIKKTKKKSYENVLLELDKISSQK